MLLYCNLIVCTSLIKLYTNILGNVKGWGLEGGGRI